MFAAAIFARPSLVRGPELAPPCSRQRPFRLFAGRKQGEPWRVLAPHRCPGQSGPNRHSIPMVTLSFAIIWAPPLMGYYFTANFAGLREGPQQVHGQRLLVAGAGFEPRSTPKQNRSLLSLPFHNPSEVRVTNTPNLRPHPLGPNRSRSRKQPKLPQLGA